MIKIGELIQQYCPKGCKYIPLKDTSYFYFHHGKGNKIPEDTGGIYDVYGANGVVSHIDEYNCEDVSIIGHIGAVGLVNRCKEKCFVTYNGTIAEVCDKSMVNSQYFYYVLTTLNLPSYKKGSQPFLSVSDYEDIEIPIPPLPVQEEIARILDKFTELKIELETELETELEMRKKQYEYYRDKLISLEDYDGEVEWKPLSKVAKRLKGSPVTAGQMKNMAVEGGNITIFGGGATKVQTDEKHTSKFSIITVPSVLVKSRGIVDVEYCDFPYTFKQEMWAYEGLKDIDTKFLYYYLQTKVDMLRYKGSIMGSMPQIKLDDTETIMVPIIDINEQKRIVDILDKFSTLTSDISEGLPAEIKMRHQQYEYYRDKLLTFDRLEDAI